MDSSTYFAAIVVLVYANVASLFAHSAIIRTVQRIYFVVSKDRFAGLYYGSEDSYDAYKYFKKPSISRADYLRAFQGYDVDVAHQKFHHLLQKDLAVIRRSIFKQLPILLLLVLLLHPVILGSCIVGASFFIIRTALYYKSQKLYWQYDILSELVESAVRYTFAPTLAEALLHPKHSKNKKP